MSRHKERAILKTLRERGPMPAKTIAVFIESPWRTVANLCSDMKSRGVLSEEDNMYGNRHGRCYAVERSVLARDVQSVRELIDAYGERLFGDLVREARTPGEVAP